MNKKINLEIDLGLGSNNYELLFRDSQRCI